MQAMKTYAHSMFCSVKYEEQKLALLVKWMFNELLKLKNQHYSMRCFSCSIELIWEECVRETCEKLLITLNGSPEALLQ